ncbi:MAG TPA: TonB-dependent receptor [Oxalicibacterium sp.]|nr:TonB-dependent receptor [Oxalicibacterium sp.]
MPAQAAYTGDLGDLSLEELANIQVTSVSKKSESLADAPASIFVITGEEIRRAGATTLPEALRLAPNLQVARANARNYAITSRGFNTVLENKLLVLIDGRVVYSPLYSGVYWDAQDVVLEDVKRIEVISGSGGTLWGANAVNGVINIITKSAADTQGLLVSAGGSADERNGAVRYGGKMANGGSYRIYAKHAENDDMRTANGTSTPWGWSRQQAGFRNDWASGGNKVTLQGDAYNGNLHQYNTPDIAIGGANFLGRFQHIVSDDSSIILQAYWDYTERKQPGAFIEYLNTLDLQLQHSITLSGSHNIEWGAGYRYAMDHVNNDTSFAFLPTSQNMYWGNVFIQDQLALTETLQLTTGLRLENNNYTGVEALPSLRLSWKPAADHLIWGAISRAVRAPSRFDRDLYLPPPPSSPLLAGGPDFESEVATDVEIGYRGQPTRNLSYSATLFHTNYDKLRTFELQSGRIYADNLAQGTSRGIEMWGSWQAADRWRLSAGFVTQKIRTELEPASNDLSAAFGLTTSDPSHYWMLRSSYDIDSRQELDVTFRYVGALRNPDVPSYSTMDLRYGWKIRRDLELSVIGRNLIGGTHAEFGDETGRNVFDRSIFFRLVWRK